MMRAHRLWFLVPALLLSGCLLPQPDTPIIPPLAPGPMAAPAKAPAPEALPQEAGAMADPNTTLVPPGETRMAMAALKGMISGLAVTRVVAVPEYEGPKLEAAVEDSAFALDVPVGGYKLDLITADEQSVRIDRVITLEPGVTLQLTIEAKASPLEATITEEVTIEPAEDTAASDASASAAE